MTDLLFPAFEARLKNQPKSLYGALLTDIVRGASDAIDALSLFRALLHGDVAEKSDHGFMAFDAHVGDTGCHLRAGMFLEAFTFHRKMAVWSQTKRPLAPIWIEDNIRRLEKTRQTARNICVALTKDNVRPQTVGLCGKDLPVSKALRAVGWEEFSVNGHPSLLYERESCDFLSDYFFDGQSDESSSQFSDATSQDGWSVSSADEASSLLRTRWDLRDSRMLLRLIVYSYVLSKYKVFSCTNKTVTGRLCPEAAAERGHTLMTGYWDFENTVYRKSRVERVSQELRVLQTWVSDLSCAWLHSVAERHCETVPRLLLDTTQRSKTGLTTTSCFLGYLMLRQELAQRGHRLLMIDRHFCPHGVHYNLFAASIDTTSPYPMDLDLTHPHKWIIEPVTIDDLRRSSTRSQPHFIAMGNSIHGSTLEYKTRVSSGHNTSLHWDCFNACEKNSDHVDTFIRADHDRLALAFFAGHKSYPFPIENGIDEMEFIGSRMDAALPGLREQWLDAESELEDHGGGGRDMNVFGWQHVFVEKPETLAGRLQRLIQSEDLLPLSV